jgi:hypothetical protein
MVSNRQPRPQPLTTSMERRAPKQQPMWPSVVTDACSYPHFISAEVTKPAGPHRTKIKFDKCRETSSYGKSLSEPADATTDRLVRTKTPASDARYFESTRLRLRGWKGSTPTSSTGCGKPENRAGWARSPRSRPSPSAGPSPTRYAGRARLRPWAYLMTVTPSRPGTSATRSPPCSAAVRDPGPYRRGRCWPARASPLAGADPR